MFNLRCSPTMPMDISLLTMVRTTNVPRGNLAVIALYIYNGHSTLHGSRNTRNYRGGGLNYLQNVRNDETKFLFALYSSRRCNHFVLCIFISCSV